MKEKGSGDMIIGEEMRRRRNGRSIAKDREKINREDREDGLCCFLFYIKKTIICFLLFLVNTQLIVIII